MPRPRKARTLASLPAPVIYIPAGWTQHQSTPVEVAIEDFEIMRLCDGHNLNIEDAAKKVGVSRSTAGRMLARARRAIALGFEQRAPIYLDASEELVLTPPEHLEPNNYECLRPSNNAHLAIACASPQSSSPVERMFGRAPGFAIICPDDSRLAYIQNPGTRLKRNAAAAAVKLLKTQGVSRVVAGRFGPEAIQALASATIQPIVANGFSLKQAIELFNQ
ncbi:DUF134 domain-containing protein [Coraliomargarita sp. SDUM461004]|uniref:DUF134 domain-containing protein n=1 Tax=Thalassobacterium sedimentorum TaxID=3041258 RepID=A0ABU1AMJ6_9BACT|nr:DUF134 domain-containing protein [Coraliomargarita sp. SDUM461004]MDQ8196020.1 DUF134 domain-containing protein [Coraliomargarita sp. SDUM461004]